MKRHNNQGKPRTVLEPFVCSHCREYKCEECSDILRVVIDLEEICNCKLPGHSGEPVEQQIRDPFTKSVHGPGLEVTVEGEVKRHGS